MIKIRCAVKNKEELESFVWEELVNMTMGAVSPLWNDYERYSLELDEDDTDEEKARKFAAYHLGMCDIGIKTTMRGVVIKDNLHVEDTCSDGSYDIEGFLRSIWKKYPKAKFSGSGEIDYDYSIVAYKINNKRKELEVEYEEL